VSGRAVGSGAGARGLDLEEAFERVDLARERERTALALQGGERPEPHLPAVDLCLHLVLHRERPALVLVLVLAPEALVRRARGLVRRTRADRKRRERRAVCRERDQVGSVRRERRDRRVGRRQPEELGCVRAQLRRQPRASAHCCDGAGTGLGGGRTSASARIWLKAAPEAAPHARKSAACSSEQSTASVTTSLRVLPAVRACAREGRRGGGVGLVVGGGGDLRDVGVVDRARVDHHRAP